MKTRHLTLLVLATVTALTACNQEEHLLQTNESSLKVTATIPKLTRAAIEGTQLPEGAQIGVSVISADGSDYDGQTGYKNVCYSKNTSWSSSSPIILSPTLGKAIAYYPYSADITDLTAVPVETASQTDYLYSDWVHDIAFDHPNANFILNHALCTIQINLTNQSYTSGTGEVTEVAVHSQALATTAMLNAQNGQLSAFSGQDEVITYNESFTLTKEPYAVTIVCIPTGAQEPVSVKVTIDDTQMTIPVIMHSPFVQGKLYIININVTDVPLSSKAVSVNVQDLNI